MTHSVQRANGATTSYGYDNADHLNDILTKVGTDTIDHFHYTLDRLGLRTQVDETQADASSITPSPTATGSPATATRTGTQPTATRTLTPSKTSTPSRTPTGPTSTTPPTATSTATATATTGGSTLVKKITFEGGSLTDAATGVDSVSGSTITINSSTPLKGAFSATVPNTASSYVRENLTAANTLYVSFYLRVDALPSSSAQIMGVYNSSTRFGNLQLTSSGALRLRNDSTTIGSDSAPLTVGTLYRVGLRQTKGSSTGVLEAFVVQGDNAFGTPFASSTTQGISSGVDNVRVGAVQTTAVSITVDDITLDTGTMPGPSGGTGFAPQYAAFSLRAPALDVTAPTAALTTTTPLDLASSARLFLPLIRSGSSGPVVSEPVQLANLVTNNRSITYAYDGLLRLTSAQESPGNLYAYAYDDAGNHLQTHVNGALTQDLSYNEANEVSTWGYDEAGNLTSYDPSYTVSYDALNRMVGTSFGGTQTTYAYNGDDVLTKQTTGGTVTNYTQDLAAPLSQILSDGTQFYIYGQERLFVQAGTTKTWYTNDALGSVRHTLDSAGSLSAPVRYDPFGNTVSGNTPTFGFTGELTDASGYLYLRARRYDPNVGFFTSRDPVMGQAGQPSSFNQYQYAYGDPVLNGDPSGLFCVQINATYTFGTTCQHDSILGSSAPVRFADGVVGTGLEAGRAIGEPLTAEGRATLWRGTQAIWYAPQQSWDALADYYGEQLGLAGLGARSLVNHPFCTLGTLSAEDWGAIAFILASTYTGVRGILRGAESGVASTSVTNRLTGRSALDQLISVSRPGNSSRVVIVTGDQSDAVAAFHQIADPASINPHPNPALRPAGGLQGLVPGGGRIYYRPYSTSGPPTIDIHEVPGMQPRMEIKFIP